MECLRSTVGAALFACLLTLAGCHGKPPKPAAVSAQGQHAFTVTTTGTHLTTSPGLGAFAVPDGGTITFEVTADAGYLLASAVDGDCAAGTWTAGSYVTGPVTANCFASFGAGVTVHSVSLSVDPGVTALPVIAQTVPDGAIQKFVLSLAPGFLVSVDGTCPAGTLSPGIYVTGTVTANCTVHLAATPVRVAIAATGDAQTAVLPKTPQTVSYGSTVAFKLNTGKGYTRDVAGTCPRGSFAGSVYTTGAVTANCAVNFTSTLNTSSVIPVGDAHLSISPNTMQTVNYGATQTFTVKAVNGYTLMPTIGGNCPAGRFSADTYTTGAVTASCNVSFASVAGNFVASVQR